MRGIIGSGLLILLSFAPAMAEQAAEAVDRANQQFEAAFNKGDAAAIGRLYVEKAVALPPGAAMVEGRAAIEKFWGGAIEGGIRNLSLKAVRVDALGEDAAREIGRFALDAPGQGGAIQHVEGKYVVLWRKEGDAWKLDTDIWNMNPPPGAGTK
jgi:uncharacterized protein (TIGR02246 family)